VRKRPSDAWLTLTQAAREVRVARNSLRAALRRGKLPGACLRCRRVLSVATLDGRHACRLDPKGREEPRVVIRRRDLRRYRPSKLHQRAGRARRLP